MAKAERVDRVKNTLHTEAELLRRLPEINEIADDELRESVVRAFLDGCPDGFWTKPTSSTGNHHTGDECGEFGNLIHTKRVFVVFTDLARSWQELGIISERDVENGKAACLLHDMVKYGWPSDRNDHTVSDHDLIGADVARHIGGVREEVCRIIEAHNGAWYDGPEPESSIELLFHTADMIAASADTKVAVRHAADEVLDEWPELWVREE